MHIITYIQITESQKETIDNYKRPRCENDTIRFKIS